MSAKPTSPKELLQSKLGEVSRELATARDQLGGLHERVAYLEAAERVYKQAIGALS